MTLRRKIVTALVFGGILLLAVIAVTMRSASNPASMEVLAVTTNAQGWVTARLQITNHTSRVLSFPGFGPSSPEYHCVFPSSSGPRTNFSFCGFGRQEMTLKGHTSLAFEAQWAATNPPLSVQLRFWNPQLIDRIEPHLPDQLRFLLPRDRNEIVAAAPIRP